MVAHLHPAELRGAAIGAGGSAPVILQRTDQEFLAAVLEELKTERGRARLAESVAATRTEAGVLRLFQPVHRTFHLVLLEATCDWFEGAPGLNPRLDPASIDSAGLVIRKRARGAGGEDFRLGWMRRESAVRGWVTIAPSEVGLDPDPARRRPVLRAGNREITRRIPQPARGLDGFTESVTPLFVAPPEVCAAAGRTLLYGLVPLASAERSEIPPDPSSVYSPEGAEEPPLQTARNLLPSFLRAGRTHLSPGAESADAEVGAGLTLLTSLGVFDATVGPAAELFAALDTLRVSGGEEPSRGLGQVLKSAASVFRDPEHPRADAGTLSWTLLEADETRLAEALLRVLEGQLASVASGEPRYDPHDGLYELRAFMRVRTCAECPPELVWSAPSEPFAIVPWFESGSAPPTQVALPDLTQREALKKLRPDVAFVAPAAMLELVKAIKPKETLLEGQAPEPKVPAPIQWLCGFNIPIITICALILLFIVLNLLNFVFRWLPYVYVCLPIPRKPPAPPRPPSPAPTP